MLSNRVRVIGAAGPLVRIEVDGRPVTITTRDALALSAALLRAVFADDPEGLRQITAALERVANAPQTRQEPRDGHEPATMGQET